MTDNELKVDIESIINEAQTDYYDGDIVVMESLKNIPTDNPCKLELLIVIYCARGRVECCINDSYHRLEKGNIMICLPNSLVTDINTSDDIDLKILDSRARLFSEVLTSAKTFGTSYYTHLITP